MEDQLLTTYSFLAALSDRETDIYSAVYIPICRRALSLYARKGTNAGTELDIKEIITTNYGIDVPIVIVRKILKAFVQNLSQRSKIRSGFKIFENGNIICFQFNTFPFDGDDVIYDQEREKTKTLQEEFETFAKKEGEETEEIPRFADFINRNKNKISSFLSGREDIPVESIETSFMPHVRFLQNIALNNDTLYNTAKRIFVGSIIASYLESDIDLYVKAGKGITYYLDTKIVLELLDLQMEEETRPAQELVDLIRHTGGCVKVLNITLEEIRSSLDYAYYFYNNQNPTSSINEAFIRNNRRKDELISLRNRLEAILKGQYGITIERISEADLEKYEVSPDSADLKNIWFKDKAAVHDVSAYLYVRDRRGSNRRPLFIQKENFWFVSANERLCKFNRSKKDKGQTAEIIMPGVLTSLLFLQNPKKLSDTVSVTGLHEMIAQTLSDEYPSKDLINDFAMVVSSTQLVPDEDFIYLLREMSKSSTIKIHGMLGQLKNDVDEFRKEANIIVARAREKEQKEGKEYSEVMQKNRALSDKNENLSQEVLKLSQQVKSVRASMEQKLDEMSKVNSEELEIVKKSAKRRNVFLISVILFLVGVILFILARFVPDSLRYAKEALRVAGSLGWIWSFGSFVINLKKGSK